MRPWSTARYSTRSSGSGADLRVHNHPALTEAFAAGDPVVTVVAARWRGRSVCLVVMDGQPDAVDLLGAAAPYLVAQRVVEAAATIARCPVAAYVLDLEGLFALRLAGDGEQFPARIRTPVGVGPEVIPEALPRLRELVADRVGPSTLWPLAVRDRVMGFLLARDRPADDLAEFVGQAALALELASGYTDALHAVRRRKDTKPAAEIQQNLLPPRLAHVNGADVAGGVLPGYDVGGDFFDYADNADGLWLVVADATGKGDPAAALSSLAVGALRAARRAGAGLQEAARLTDEAIMGLDTQRYLTAVFGSWDAAEHRFRWINCGHPTPLILHADGRLEELDGERTYPLGVRFTERVFPLLSAVVEPGDRLLLYSDGVTERRADEGSRIGEAGLRAILTNMGPRSAAMTVRGLQDAVVGASSAPLHDDATLLVMVPRT